MYVQHTSCFETKKRVLAFCAPLIPVFVKSNQMDKFKKQLVIKQHLYLGNRLNYACMFVNIRLTNGILKWLENQNMKYYENNTIYIMFVIVTCYETT